MKSKWRVASNHVCGEKDKKLAQILAEQLNREDEAPLIDVPEGSDEPDYGPEKIPRREGKK